jgi:SAM-dependent methyltransferase
MVATDTIYARADYASVDVGAQMRLGHPDIAEGDALIVERVARFARSADSPIRVLEVGSGSGYLIELLSRAVPNAELVANEVEPALAAQARRRFDGTRVQVFDRSFEEWDKPLDVLISWGAHHHLTSPSHLAHAAKLLSRGGLFLLGDEFCPDYLDAEDSARVASAEVIFTAQGHLLTTRAEVADFRATGEIPEWSKRLERRRRRALWHWYKFVVDYAMDKGDDVVVEAELRIAADDLNTAFADEHKISAVIVRRDLALHGFVERAYHALREEQALASMAVLELTAAVQS